MKTKITFKIFTKTSFGIGCFDIKASDFEDAFSKLSKTDKNKLTSILAEDGEERFFNN